MSDFIGQGWRFPIRVNAKGGLDWSSGPERIQDTIWIIIRTALGERVMRPKFGRGRSRFLSQSNSPLVRASLASAISTALLQWEPRIEVAGVNVDPDPGEPSQVLVSIDYRIRSTNTLSNVVYPFYLEGEADAAAGHST